jgi:FAD/FMN-containing dehydrogenase
VEEEDGGEFISMVAATPVMLRKALIHTLAGLQDPTEVVSESFNALTNLRHDRFNEMEYSIPVASGPDCLREILATIKRESIDVAIPLEYRIIGGDDAWLSMFVGGPRVSISVHRMASQDYRPLFNRIEPIFWKYGGRPHWGKVHTLGYDRLRELYPKYDDFVALQASLDPQGRMLNDHLKYLLGR